MQEVQWASHQGCPYQVLKSKSRNVRRPGFHSGHHTTVHVHLALGNREMETPYHPSANSKENTCQYVMQLLRLSIQGSKCMLTCPCKNANLLLDELHRSNFGYCSRKPRFHLLRCDPFVWQNGRVFSTVTE